MRKRGSFLRKFLFVHLPVFLLVLFALAPYAWSVVSSLTPERDFGTEAFRYFPANPTTENYARLFERIRFWRNIRDSLTVAGSTMLAGLGITVTASYAFSRFRFRGRNYLLVQFLVINMFPVVLLLVPLFIIMKTLGLMDTYFALIIAYSTFTIPFSTWMMTSFFNAVPRELDEAAMIDGCSRFGALARIVFPVALPGISATGIYIFITAWNEFLYAVMLTGTKIRTIPVALQGMVGEYEIAWGLLNAGGVVSAVPVTALFFFIQKRLVSGMTAGAVKG